MEKKNKQKKRDTTTHLSEQWKSNTTDKIESWWGSEQ